MRRQINVFNANKWLKTMFGVLCICLLNTQCVVGKYDREVSSPNVEIQDVAVNTKNRFVDLVIKEQKVTGYSSGSSGAFNFSLDKLKRDAISDAIIKSEADVIVAPFYVVKTENNMVYVEVRGFPANYKKLNQ